MIVRQLGLQEYSVNFDRMKAFNEQRDKNTADEIWILEHKPVFTQLQKLGTLQFLEDFISFYYFFEGLF